PEFTSVLDDPLGMAASYVLRHYPFPTDILALQPQRLARELSTGQMDQLIESVMRMKTREIGRKTELDPSGLR
ncbi:MAG: hypothetical protein ACOY94_12815, partial [Bacillota bacterium]